MGTLSQRLSCLAIHFLVQSALTGLFLTMAVVMDTGLGSVTVRLLYYSAISLVICFGLGIATRGAGEGLHRLALITATTTNISLIGFGLAGGLQHSQALVGAALYGVLVVLTTPLAVSLAVPVGSALLLAMYAWLYGKEVDLGSDLATQLAMGTSMLLVLLVLGMRVLLPRLLREWARFHAKESAAAAKTADRPAVAGVAG